VGGVRGGGAVAISRSNCNPNCNVDSRNQRVEGEDDSIAMCAALIVPCGSSKYQSQRGDVPRIGLQMSRQQVEGLLFFRGEVRTCGYDVSSTSARLHSDGLRLLPIDFYVTFDDFLTVKP